MTILLFGNTRHPVGASPTRGDATGKRRSDRVLKALLIPGALGILPAVGCQAPVDRIGVIIDRHHNAITKPPEADRSRLMPYGPPVLSAADLLPAGVLDLETARALAIRANPGVHAALARLEAAAARAAQARARYFPTVVLTHNSTQTFHTPASRNRLDTALQPTGGVPTDIDSDTFAITTLLNALRRPLFGLNRPKGNRNPFSEHSTALTVTWFAFDGFVREAQLLAAKHLHGAAEQSLIDVQRLIIQAVDTAYYQIQLAREQLRIAKADEAFSREQLEETEKLRAAGRASQADVDNFRVRMLAAQANVSEAYGLAETGRVVLAELIGLTDATLPHPVTLTDLEDETETEMDAPTSDVWIERARQNRPDLLQLEHLLDSQEEIVRAAKGLYQPTVAMSGSWGFDRSSNLRLTVEDQSSAAALELRWELYTGGSRRARVREAQSTRAEAAAQLYELQLAVKSQVRIAVIHVEIAQEQIRLQRENLAITLQNRRIVQAGYSAGKETLNRLNEAQRDVISADAALTLARIRLRQAWSDLHAAAADYRQTTTTPGT